MGCEAIQRGATEVVAIEKDRRTALIAKKNLLATAHSQQTSTKVEVVSCSVESWLRLNPNPQPFDLIYFDPPYGAGIYTRILEQICTQRVLHPMGLLICEHNKNRRPDIDEGSWTIHDHRDYGNTGLLFLELSRREHCPVDTDSKQPQTNPEV